MNGANQRLLCKAFSRWLEQESGEDAKSIAKFRKGLAKKNKQEL